MPAADIGELYIEAVLDHMPKGFKRPPRAELRFLIQWLGYDASENSWELWKNLRTNRIVHAYCRANNMMSIVSRAFDDDEPNLRFLATHTSPPDLAHDRVPWLRPGLSVQVRI